MRRRLESVALGAATVAVAAFAVSFAFGLRGGAARSVDLPAPEPQEDIVAPLNVSSGRRIEVLNASRRPGLARQATLRLREAGYDVVYYGTASGADEGRSVVLDRVGNPEVARGAARALGIDEVDSRTDSTRQVEASVILSSDWAPTSTAAPGTPAKWWDRLRFWRSPG